MDTNEPFGLPKGTVRGVLALIFTLSTTYLWVTGQAVPAELLVTTSLVVGNYFGSRTGATDNSVSVTKIEPPFIPGETDQK